VIFKNINIISQMGNLNRFELVSYKMEIVEKLWVQVRHSPFGLGVHVVLWQHSPPMSFKECEEVHERFPQIHISWKM
jgi:hypothetical protein